MRAAAPREVTAASGALRALCGACGETGVAAAGWPEAGIADRLCLSPQTAADA
ncbi:MAG: hypothetical protein JWR70_547 [Modestobacter sp.]|nr:hypothetical protein [Modestobacter sp.]